MFEALDSACVNFGVTWYQVVKQVSEFGYRIHQGDTANFWLPCCERETRWSVESQELWSDGLSINSATVARADTQQQCCPIREHLLRLDGTRQSSRLRHPGGNHGDSLQPGYFQQTHGPLLHGKRVPPDILGWAGRAG